MANFIGAIMGLVLAVVMVASVLIPTVEDANTTGWDASTVTIFTLTGLVAAAGLVYSAASIFGVI